MTRNRAAAALGWMAVCVMVNRDPINVNESTVGAPFVAAAANRLLTAATNVLFGSALTDMETCYKVMRTGVARSLGLTANRFEIEPEITAKLLRRGHAIRELPVRFDPRSRAQGKKIGWRDGIHALRVLVAERFK